MQHSEIAEDDDKRTTLLPSSSVHRVDPFVPVGRYTAAVLLKLQQELPRIVVRAASREGTGDPL